MGSINCPVYGGHGGATMVPVISQCTPALYFDVPATKALTERIQGTGTEVVEQKDGEVRRRRRDACCLYD